MVLVCASFSFQLYAEKVSNRGLCAVAQCESLRYKLVGGLAVRRACYGVLRFIMESNAQGCEVRLVSIFLQSVHPDRQESGLVNKTPQ